MVGVVAITTLVAILQGVKAEISRQVEGLGANLVLIVPSKLDDNGQPNPAAMIGISSLTERDLSALQSVPGVARVAPVYIVAGTVDLKNGPTASAFVVATNRAGVQMNPTPVAEGRYYADNEGNVCILGYRPRHDLFGDGPALGRVVHIAGHNWTVVGVLGETRYRTARWAARSWPSTPWSISRRPRCGGRCRAVRSIGSCCRPTISILPISWWRP